MIKKFKVWMDEAQYMTDVFTLSTKPRNVFDSDIILQFTGLFDKNGKEIYEGDIISNEFGDHYEVKWDEERAEWQINRDEDGELRFYPDWFVIGNVYENPELLTDSTHTIRKHE